MGIQRHKVRSCLCCHSTGLGRLRSLLGVTKFVIGELTLTSSTPCFVRFGSSPERDAVHTRCREQRRDKRVNLLRGSNGKLRTKVRSYSQADSEQARHVQDLQVVLRQLRGYHSSIHCRSRRYTGLTSCKHLQELQVEQEMRREAWGYVATWENYYSRIPYSLILY